MLVECVDSHDVGFWFLYFTKPSKGHIQICLISASGKTPSAAKHTIGCASPDDIDTNPGLSKTMTREPSYWQNRFKTYSFHENQKGGFLLVSFWLFWEPLVSLWAPFGLLWFPLECPWAPFGRPLGSLWPPWGIWSLVGIHTNYLRL